MNKRELRLRILQALSDWEHSGERYLPKAWQIAEGLGVNLQDIIDQFDILEVEGAVDNYSKYYGDKKKDNTASITGVGKKILEQTKQSSDLKLQDIKVTEIPKAFIAHKGESKSLDKLKDFLDALGVKYLIAETEPSNGRLVEQQVTWTYEHADFAIILATKGGVISKRTGAPYMGMNVADELGRARAAFKNRVILLLEKGVKLHTNISGIVYEQFASQSMDKALIKVARELRNWGIITLGITK